MKISADRLAGHLTTKLAPAYLITGDEPLLVDEAADGVRARARDMGFTERERHIAAAQGFDWDLLAGHANLSLFASRKIVEIRLPTGKTGARGNKAIAALADQLDADTCLLVITPKLDNRVTKQAWVTTLEKLGVWVQVWGVKADSLPAWIAGRMRTRGLNPVGDAVNVLVERVEGNLLAADQEIEKLLLQHGEGEVDAAAVASSVADSARFDVYDLSDSALLGNTSRAIRVLDGLRAEGVAEVLVVWALTRELHVLSAMFAAQVCGRSVESVFRQHGVWSARKSLLTRAQRRVGNARTAYALLDRAVRCEAMVKGQSGGKTSAADRWREITGLVMAMCGVQTSLKAVV